jgi:hypothetical protein
MEHTIWEDAPETWVIMPDDSAHMSTEPSGSVVIYDQYMKTVKN